ncbi:hypothetical protein D4768_09625 [Rhodococcus erythropolis]|uniref:hypothetical protein n=1 Tax=Rhodococcus erythropolis TaxID=1833 RepID=UPI001F412E17|nr:hypothetical protein [Rhodococcus erythropolis]UJC77927.1 hypothetical protein D4768_09625 [Rhodococcus erythropolis]
MVALKINLADIGGRPVSSTRAVFLSAPAHRSSIVDGRIITTTPYPVDVVAGLATVTVEPGELVVEIRSGLADSRPKRVTVPDQDEVTLQELLESAYVYEPPVISLVKQYLDETKVARDQALVAAEGVADIAEDVEQVALDRAAAEAASNAAQGFASDASESSGHAAVSAVSAGDSATLAGQRDTSAASHANNASASAAAAGQSETAAAQHKEDAEAAADLAVSTAAGIQDVAADAAQVAADRIAVADDRTAVAADRQATVDARNGAVAAQGLAEDARDDAAETKTAVDNTKTAIDATLDAYGTQFTVDKNASQQAVVDATAQANRAESEADRAEQAADDIAAGAVADGAVITVKIQDGAVTKEKTSAGVQASLDKADTSIQEGDLVGAYARLDEQRFAGMATFFHDFEGMTPGSTAPVVTDSGHEVYWDSQPPFFTGNDFTSLTPGGATYACTEDLGATVTHVGARFKYAPNGGGDGGLCCVAITDRRWSLANIAETNMGVHFWCTPTSWALTVWEAGTGQVPIVYGYFDTRLTADGATEYMMQCWISGNKATIILPDGERKVALDDRFTTLSGNFAFFESMPNAATDDLACISAVRAGVGATRPPWTAGSVGSKKAAAAHRHVVEDITDATTVGRNVMKAADAAAARAAIGAGTGNGNSNLSLGTTSSTAMRGDGIQPVASLPGSPVSGILYCIPE